MVEEFVLRSRISASPLVVSVLEAFSSPCSVNESPRLFPAFSSASVRKEVRRLATLGFLVPAGKLPAKSVADRWNGSFAAAYLHFSSKSAQYVQGAAAEVEYYERRLDEESQPRQFRDYPNAKRIRLDPPGADDSPFSALLARRRTIRAFSRRKVSFAQLSALLRGTFGQTGWIDGGLLGKLISKTSPSAGGRHPIECYLVAWNVAGLPRGIYHYSVRHDALERLWSGDARGQAVAFASGQRWIAGASFICVLTAVPARTFWKYPLSAGYRFLSLDAGHLVQTFLLLATEQGLGGFMTAALQEDDIERRLGLDGVSEFPLYICGAGVPGVPGR